MAGERVPGPLSQTDRPIDVEDGTLSRTAMPKPGPIGMGKPVLLVGMGDVHLAESDRPPVRFWDFKISGTSIFYSEPLGVNPTGYLCNATEIIFSVPDYIIKARLFTSFRFCQTIQERHWQFVDGRWLREFATSSAQDDHPRSNYQREVLPRLHMYDSPGYIVDFGGPARLKSGIWTFPLSVGPNKKTDHKATQAVARNYFLTWVEGLTKRGEWERVSETLEWYSVQWVSRISPNDTWKTTPKSAIGHGLSSADYLNHST